MTLFDLRAKQEMNTGFGTAMSRGFEPALTLLVFGVIGGLLDRAFGTFPLFTIILSVFAFAGMMARAWIGYDTEMRRQESSIAGVRARARAEGKLK